MVPKNRNPETTAHQYVGTIVWKNAKGEDQRTPWSGLHAGAIEAIHAIHRYAQCERETDANRKVVRDRLQPDQYRVVGLALVYHDAVTKERLEEPVPIPTGVNPTLRQVRVPPAPTTEFSFVSEAERESQKSLEALYREPSTNPR